LRCYSLAVGVYANRNWTHIEDHIRFNLGRQTYNLDLYEESLQYFNSLIASGRQSLERQSTFLQEFVFVVKVGCPHTLTPSLFSRSHSLSLSLSHFLSLTFSLSHSLTFSLSHSLTLSLSHSLTLSLSHTHTHTLSLSLSRCLSLSLFALSLSHSLTLLLSHSLTLPLSHSLSFLLCFFLIAIFWQSSEIGREFVSSEIQKFFSRCDLI